MITAPVSTEIPLSRVVVDDEMRAAALRAIDSGHYILGEECAQLEREFAAYVGTRHAVLVGSGTDAILLVLLALGIGQGDDVILPSHTAFPTAEAVLQTGATPIFADVDATYTLDPADVRAKITARTRAIIAVHLYGYPAALDDLLGIAEQHGIALVEDACQAHGARYRGRRVGSIGAAGCFSFYPSKNMTCMGDGGAITTDRDDVAARVRQLRDHGRASKFVNDLVGFNSRFNEIQAAIARVQLRRLDHFNARRRAIAARYSALLADAPVVLPPLPADGEAVSHLYVIRCPERDALAAHLHLQGIRTGLHYPVPCHRQPAVTSVLPRVRLPRTERYVDEILSLPIFPELSDAEVDRVVEAILDFYRGGHARANGNGQGKVGQL